MENFSERNSPGSVVICAARDENIVIPEQGRAVAGPWIQHRIG
jgi:hypothetical protein